MTKGQDIVQYEDSPKDVHSLRSGSTTYDEGL